MTLENITVKFRAYSIGIQVETNCLALSFVNQGNMDATLGADLVLEPGDSVEFGMIPGCIYRDNVPLRFGARNGAYATDPDDNPNVLAIRTDLADL